MKACSKYYGLIELLPSIDCNDHKFANLLTHLKACPKCLRKYLLSQHLDRGVKQSMQDVTASPFLLAKVKFQCRQQRIKRRRIFYKWSLLYKKSNLSVKLEEKPCYKYKPEDATADTIFFKESGQDVSQMGWIKEKN